MVVHIVTLFFLSELYFRDVTVLNFCQRIIGKNVFKRHLEMKLGSNVTSGVMSVDLTCAFDMRVRLLSHARSTAFTRVYCGHGLRGT